MALDEKPKGPINRAIDVQGVQGETDKDKRTPPQVPPRGRAPAQPPQVPQRATQQGAPGTLPPPPPPRGQTPVQQQRTQGSQPATATPTRKPRVRLGPPPRPATQGGQTQVPPIDATMNNSIGTPDNVGESIASSSPINNNKFDTMSRVESANGGVPFENGSYPQGDINNNENEVNTNSQVASEPSKNDNDSVDSKETDTPKKSGNVVKRVFNKIFNGKKKDQEESMDQEVIVLKMQLLNLYNKIDSKRKEKDDLTGLKKIKVRRKDIEKCKTVEDIVEVVRNLMGQISTATMEIAVINAALAIVNNLEENVDTSKVIHLLGRFNMLIERLWPKTNNDEEQKKFREELDKLNDEFLMEAAVPEETIAELKKQYKRFNNRSVQKIKYNFSNDISGMIDGTKVLIDSLCDRYKVDKIDIGKRLEVSVGKSGIEECKQLVETKKGIWNTEETKKVLHNINAALETTSRLISELRKEGKQNPDKLIKTFNRRLERYYDEFNERTANGNEIKYEPSESKQESVKKLLNGLKTYYGGKEDQEKAIDEEIGKVDSVIESMEKGEGKYAFHLLGSIREFIIGLSCDADKRKNNIGEIIKEYSNKVDALVLKAKTALFNTSFKDRDINFKVSDYEKSTGDLDNLIKLNEDVEKVYKNVLNIVGDSGKKVDSKWIHLGKKKRLENKPSKEIAMVFEKNYRYVEQLVARLDARRTRLEKEKKKNDIELENEDKGFMGKAGKKAVKTGKRIAKTSKRLGEKLSIKLGLKKVELDENLNQTNVEKCFKDAGGYFKKACESAEKEKDSKKKDKHFTAAGLIKNFSVLKKTDWYNDFKGMLEGTKTTVKSSKPGKKGDILAGKLLMSLLGLKSGKNVIIACRALMESGISLMEEHYAICSDVRNKFKAKTTKDELEKILRNNLVNDYKIFNATQFSEIAGKFGPWPDPAKKESAPAADSEETKQQQEAQQRGATPQAISKRQFPAFMSRRAPTPEEYENGWKPYGVPSDAQSPTPISQDSSIPPAPPYHGVNSSKNGQSGK